MTLLVVRHAVAVRRSDWSKPDRGRPLTSAGRRQAAGLASVLAPFDVRRILSSPFDRCIQTVEPLAGARGLEVEAVDELAEGAGAAAMRLHGLFVEHAVLLCTHGDVVPVLLSVMAPDAPRFEPAKGSTWVVEDDGHATYVPPPKSRR